MHLCLPLGLDITPVLGSVQWLPGTQLIIFKIALIIHKACTTHFSSYLRNIIRDHIPGIAVHSDTQTLIWEYRIWTATVARAFVAAAPTF